MKRLRILFLITTLELGGAQRDVLYFVRKLDKGKFDISLAASSKGLLVEEASKIEDIRLFLVPQLQRRINPIRDLISFLKLLRIIKKEKIDILHTHSSKAGILGRWAARLAGVPVMIHTVHGWSFHEYQPKIIRNFFILLEKLTARITTKLITVSKATMEEGLGRGIGRPSQYEVIYGGIDVERFTELQIDVAQKRLELGLDPARPVVGMVARLESQKAPLAQLRQFENQICLFVRGCVN